MQFHTNYMFHLGIMIYLHYQSISHHLQHHLTV
nr:MAG TPA: hypothetical protein [Caudoviricetes sp.]